LLGFKEFVLGIVANVILLGFLIKLLLTSSSNDNESSNFNFHLYFEGLELSLFLIITLFFFCLFKVFLLSDFGIYKVWTFLPDYDFQNVGNIFVYIPFIIFIYVNRI